MTPPPFVQDTDSGAVIEVFVQPRAPRTAVVGLHEAAAKLKVAAPPVDDEANRSAERLLAKVLGVTPGGVHVVSGQRSRHKRIRVAGISAELVARKLEVVLASGPHES